MKGIITVTGLDQTGIIAKVSGHLYDNNINILDISQTIVQRYFNMIMIVDLAGRETDFNSLSQSLTELGDSLGHVIRLQREDIFNSMHRI